MQASPSSSSCSKSSSSSSVSPTRLSNRLETIFKKAFELSILCAIEVCVIYYGSDGELKTWPEDREKVKNIAFRYRQKTNKKSINLHEFLEKKSEKNLKKPKKDFKKEANLKKKNVNQFKYPIIDHYSPDQISRLIQNFERKCSILQERIRFVESQKQKETKSDHQISTPIPLNHHHPVQFLNPSQFSLFMYNHRDTTLSQIPLSASNFNQIPIQFTNYPQDFSGFVQVQKYESNNHLMQKELCGCNQNMSMSGITNINFQHSCFSNTRDSTALLAVQEQELVNNCSLNQLVQHELYGYDQNMCTIDITNNNVRHPCLSNTVSDEFGSDFQNIYGNTSFSQDMSSSYVSDFDESSILQSSTLSSLYTIPNSCILSKN